MVIAERTQIVITGAAGFIGSYTAKSLLRLGVAPESLILVDDAAFFDERSCTAELKNSDLHLMTPEKFLEDFERGAVNPRIIYHIGACSSTTETRVDYLERVNVDYSKRIWVRCTATHTPLLYASSAATYGDGSLGFDDSESLLPKLQPLNPYGQSKQNFDLFVLEQKKLGLTPPYWAGFKYFNVYGPGEEHKGSQASVFYHASRQLLRDGEIRLFKSDHPQYGDGEQLRDFVFVNDVVQVMEFFATGQGKSGIYNVGTGKARSFNDLASAVAAALGKKLVIRYIDMPENLKSRYQYFTEARLENLRAAGFGDPFVGIEEGARLYLK